jgi:hypothetical protein
MRNFILGVVVGVLICNWGVAARGFYTAKRELQNQQKKIEARERRSRAKPAPDLDVETTVSEPSLDRLSYLGFKTEQAL